MLVACGRIHGRLGRNIISLRSLKCGVVGGNIRRRLHILQRCQHLALFHAIAFFHVEVGDLPESIGADIDVNLWLDFSRCGHYRREVLADHFSCLHRNHALAALLDREPHNGQKYDNSSDDECEFLPVLHSILSQTYRLIRT